MQSIEKVDNLLTQPHLFYGRKIVSLPYPRNEQDSLEQICNTGNRITEIKAVEVVFAWSISHQFDIGYHVWAERRRWLDGYICRHSDKD